MPIYEYHCKKCGDFEVMQKMSDAPLSECPTCHRKVNKLISSTSFQLKGSGWYVTDYARKGSSSGGKGEKKGGDGKGADAKTADAKTADAKTGDGKTETKTESTSSDTGSSSKSGGEKAAAA
jgi:putative FmdB family regulatory protein